MRRTATTDTAGVPSAALPAPAAEVPGGAFLPKDERAPRRTARRWLWQIGSAPLPRRRPDRLHAYAPVTRRARA